MRTNPMQPPLLDDILKILTKHHGPPPPIEINDPFELILFENCAYLVDDAKRLRTWKELKKKVGVSPRAILKSSPAKLLDAIRDGGLFADQRVEKLRKSAQLTIDEFDGDLRQLLKLPFKKARSALKKFPGIGEPGAEKILLLLHAQPILALESNGLRCLQRLGYGDVSKNYSKSYRSTQQSLADQCGTGCDRLITVHQLLRTHGQTICRRTMPECNMCGLSKLCIYARRAAARA